MSVRNILDGTIPVGGSGGLTPESEIQVKKLICPYIHNGELKTGLINVDDVFADTITTTTHMKGAKLTVTGNTATQTLTASESITTPSLTLGGKQMLTREALYDEVKFKGLKAVGATAANFTQKIDREVLNITPGLHVFIMNLNLTTEPLSQLIIPTGLSCIAQTMWWDKTLLKTNDNQYLEAQVLLGEDGGKLSLKLIIPTGSTYTSFQARIIITFH